MSMLDCAWSNSDAHEKDKHCCDPLPLLISAVNDVSSACNTKCSARPQAQECIQAEAHYARVPKDEYGQCANGVVIYRGCCVAACNSICLQAAIECSTGASRFKCNFYIHFVCGMAFAFKRQQARRLQRYSREPGREKTLWVPDASMLPSQNALLQSPALEEEPPSTVDAGLLGAAWISPD